MVSRYNNGYGGIPNQNTAAPNHHNPHGMMAAMTMVRPHRPHPPPTSQHQLQQHATNLANHAAAQAASMSNQNTVMKPMNHSHASAMAAVANMQQQHHNLSVAQGTPPPSHPPPVQQLVGANSQSNLGPQNHSQHSNKLAQQQIVHNNVNANHHNSVQVPHSTYRAMHPRTDNYHASQANVAGGFANTVTGHHNQQIGRGAMPQTQQPQVDGSQKNPQQQVYQQQQRQNHQQQYQRAPTKNLTSVGMRPPVNSQQTLNNQLIGAQGAQPMYLPQHFAYPTAYGPNSAIIYGAGMQYPAMTGYPRQYSPVYFTASNMNYTPTPRGTAPTVATAVPIQSMSGSTLSQQNMMTNQIAASVVQQQPTVPVQPKRSHALVIRDPNTLEPIQTDFRVNSNVDASETASTTSTLDNDCNSETGRSTDDLPPEFIPGQPLSSSSGTSVTDAQQLLQTTDTPVVSAKMDGPDITPKQNINKNKKKIIESTQKQHVDPVNEVKSSQSEEVITTATIESPQAADQENIETSAVTVESEYVGHETVPETVVPEKMSPPLPQPVPVIESVLSYEAKSFEPRKQREQVLHRESVERSNVDMDIKQGQTIVEPTSDTNKNIITNSSLPPSKKDETDHSISTSTTISSEIAISSDETTNTLDSNIVNNNTIIKVEEPSFKKEKSTTPVSVPPQQTTQQQQQQPAAVAAQDSVKIVDINKKEQKTDVDQINANDAMPAPPVPALLHASKTAPSSLQMQHQPHHRKSEEAIRLEKPIKSAGSRSLEKPKPTIEYREDQWRPDNPEGKRKYTLDQLKVLGNTEVAKEKPNLPDSLLRALTPGKGGHTVGGGGGGNQHRNDIRGFTGLMPDFASKSGMPMYNKRPSQQGNRGQGGQGGNKSGSRNQEPLKRISLKMQDPIKLREVENAWRPKMLQGEDGRTKEEKETDELYRKFRSVMNKLTPENFDILLNEIMSAQIDTVDRLKGCIKLVFEKAIAEPTYCTIYAKVCKRLSSINISKDSENKEEKPITFRVILLNQCQHEFEKHKDDQSGQTIKNEAIEKETDDAKRKELMEQQEEEAIKIRRRAVGTVRFIGELYKIEMLNDKIMLNCIQILLDNGDEDSLECLCKLLTTIGLRMESNAKILDNCFKKLNEFGDKKSKVQVSSRIRFAIKDVIDLRRNRWQPRRSDTNPKTMGQIQKEQETEHRNIEIMNYQTPRKDDRRGGSMGKFSNKKDNDGWMTPSSNKNNRVPQQTFDIGKVKTNMSVDTMKLGPTMRLGPSQGFNTLFQNRFADLSNDTSSNEPQVSGGSGLSRDNQPYNSNKYDNYSSNSNNRGNMQRQSSRENSRHRNDMNGPSRSFQANPLSRQSSSNRDDRSNTQSQIIGRRSQQAEPVTAVPSAAPASEPYDLTCEPSEAELRKIKASISTSLYEYVNNNVLTDFVEDLREFVRKTRWVAIREVHSIALEKKEIWREAVSKVCFHCLSLNDASLLKKEEYKHAIKKYFEQIVDNRDDNPLIFNYTAVYVEETVNAGFLTLKDLYEYSGMVIDAFLGGEMLVALLGQLVQRYGPGRVRELWAASGLHIKQFLGDDGSNDQKVADFIAKHKLEYLTDSKSKAEVSSKLTDGSKIQIRLTELLKTKSDSNDDQMIHEWIQANVADTESKEFIRALTTAVIEFCLENKKLNENLFVNRANDLLRKYIDGKGDRELQVLYAVQNICKHLEYPQGLLLSICSALSDNYTVSREGFKAWQDDETANPIDAEGKGVCMKSLNNFFFGILCDESESDEDEDDPNTAA